MIGHTVAEVAGWVDAVFTGDGDALVCGVATFDEASETDLVFVTAPRYAAAAVASRAVAVVAPTDLAIDGKTAIRAGDPKLAIARIATRLYPAPPVVAGIHPGAVVDPEATIDPGAAIGPHVHVAAGVTIAPEVVVEAGCVLAAGVAIGRGSVLRPQVVVYPRTVIGERVLVHAGAVLGADGFGWVRSPEGLVKFPQIGRLVIEDDVEIGANTTIDRGALGSTRIARGTKIDNQVQIAHNVQVGVDCALSAQVGIAGSARLDARVTLGGQVGVGDHARVGEDVMAGGQAGILSGKKVRPGEILWGTPARPLDEVKRQRARLTHLDTLLVELRALRNALGAQDRDDR